MRPCEVVIESNRLELTFWQIRLECCIIRSRADWCTKVCVWFKCRPSETC